MTEHKSFKRLVRARMAKTGESYTAARAILLAAPSRPRDDGADGWRPPTRRSVSEPGAGWEEWFELLDEWGAADRSHREIARWLAEQQASTRWRGTCRRSPPATSRPAACVRSARRTTASRSPPRGRWRCRSSGCTRLWSRTARADWLPDGRLSERTATRPKSARFDWGGGDTRVNVTFLAKGEAKSTGGARAPATRRCRGGGTDEGLLARASRRAQARFGT